MCVTSLSRPRRESMPYDLTARRRCYTVRPFPQRQPKAAMLSLALLRHAKSSWDASDIEDVERPLNERGRTAVPVMGEVLKELKFAPQLVLCSPAKRTRETLALIAP